MHLGEEMEDFVMDLYNYNQENRLLEYKIHELTQGRGEVIVVETRCPITADGKPDEDFLPKYKKGVRMEFYPYFDTYHNIIHGPDSISEMIG